MPKSAARVQAPQGRAEAAVKLQAWGIEIAGRCHSILLMCQAHGWAAAASDFAKGLPGGPRTVRLEQLDAVFAGGPYHCFACNWSSEAGAGSPSEIWQGHLRALQSGGAEN